MAKFQVKLGRDWQDYSKEEDKILKRAFMAGFPTAKFHLRGQNYEYNFKNMSQKNKDSGKERDIRAPNKWKQPKKPLVEQGPTTVITVPAGTAGTTIQVPYPGVPGGFISVNVPKNAKAGQAMLVPIPKDKIITSGGEKHEKAEPAKGGGWSTGAVVAVGAGAAGLGVAGAILGVAVAEEGADAVGDMLADGAVDAGEAVGDFAVDAGEFLVDAGEEVGDFIMDLF